MEYIFDTNRLHVLDQLEILNRLIFDASFDLRHPDERIVTNTSLQLELERRTFENVTRKESFFGTSTLLSGITSIIRFENVTNIVIEGFTEDSSNDFIDEIAIEDDTKLAIFVRTSQVKITMTLTDKTKIYLKDIKESEFGKGTVGGKCGFTSEEWTAFLKEKNYSMADTQE